MPSMQEIAEANAIGRRIWIKAFWGFDPEGEGFIGFSRERDRENLLRQYKTGDLILIYGTAGKQTEVIDRRQALGFLEIGTERIDASSRMSDAARKWKESVGRGGSWNYAVPVSRAWRVTHGQSGADIRVIAPNTYSRDLSQHIATRGELLQPHEVKKALELDVAEVPVFGSNTGVSAEGPLFEDSFKPSASVKSKPGRRLAEYLDGPCQLYLMRWTGPSSQLLGDRMGDVSNRTVVKVGRSSSPARRCKGLNKSLPEASVTRWAVESESSFYPSIDAADEAETSLKELFDKEFKSLGGEFFLGELSKVGTEFLSFVSHSNGQRR